MEAIPMTSSHLQGHSLVQAFHVWFLYSCAAVDKISTDSVLRGFCVVAELLVEIMWPDR